MIDDSQLLRNYALRRSEADFSEIVHRHIDLVYGSALRRLGGDGHLAHDVTQAVFVALARKAGAVSRHASLVGWLHTSTRFAATQIIRAAERRRRYETSADIMNALHLAEELDWDQLRPVIDDTIDQLNDKDRVAVLLRFFEGRTLNEIANTLSISEDGARKRVDRALEKLREVLAQRGITSTTAALTAVIAVRPAVAAPAEAAASAITCAVAATSGGWSALTSILQLMFTSKITPITVAALLTITVGLALRSTVAAPSNPASTTAKALAVPASSAIPVPTQRASVPSGSDLADSAPADSAAAIAPTNPTGPTASGTPTYAERRQRLVVSARRRLGALYGALFQKLNLSDEAAKRLGDLIVEKQQIRTDASSAASAQKLAVSNETIARYQKDADEQIEELLGPTGWETYVEYERSFVKRNMVNMLQASLPDKDKLTPEQAEQLLQTMWKTAQSRTNAKTGADYRIDIIGLTLNQAAGISGFQLGGISKPVIAEAANYLTAEQLAALSDLRAGFRKATGKQPDEDGSKQ